MLPLLCVPLLFGIYNTIAWLKFLNTPSALRMEMYGPGPLNLTEHMHDIYTPYFTIQLQSANICVTLTHTKTELKAI